jgi:CRP/FNR family cyclic AMP-dependent transcriptional regulator
MRLGKDSKVELIRKVPLFSNVTKGDRSINTMREGDFFGEIALVTKMPRTASVTATSDVRVLVITERDFSALLKRSPDVGRGVAEALAERVAPELPV